MLPANLVLVVSDSLHNVKTMKKFVNDKNKYNQLSRWPNGNASHCGWDLMKYVKRLGR